MALLRCDDHRPELSGRDYETYVLPLGYPETAATCEVDCDRPGRLWLTADEKAAFRTGTRVFAAGGGTRLRVADDLFPN